MNTTKISNHQLFSLTASFTCGSSVLVISSTLSAIAKQDAWISSIVSMILGLPIILLYCYLGILFPNKSFIQIIISVFGKWAGSVISFFFIFFSFFSCTQVISYVGSFMTTEYFIKTPVYAANILIVLLLGLALIYGLESTARSSEIFFKVIWIIMLLMFVSNIPNLRIKHILPIMENGFSPIIKGAIFMSSYSAWPLIMLNMIYPTHVENPKKASKAIIKGYLIGHVVLIAVNLETLLVLGSKLSAISSYPTFYAAKEISLKFLSRTESLVISVWVVTLFIKAFGYFYSGLMGTSQLFGLKEYNKIIPPFLLLVLIYSNIVYPSAAYMAYWDKYVWVLYSGTMSVTLVIVLLIVYCFRRKKCALE